MFVECSECRLTPVHTVCAGGSEASHPHLTRRRETLQLIVHHELTGAYQQSSNSRHGTVTGNTAQRKGTNHRTEKWYQASHPCADVCWYCLATPGRKEAPLDVNCGTRPCALSHAVPKCFQARAFAISAHVSCISTALP